MKSFFKHSVAALAGLMAFAALPAVKASPRPQAAPPRYRVEGVVKDPSGAVVTAAQVTLRAAGYEATQTTDADGHFVFSRVPAANGSLLVRAKGFAELEERWSAGADDTASVEVVLHPASTAEQVTVTATRMQTPLSQTTADVRVLTHREIGRHIGPHAGRRAPAGPGLHPFPPHRQPGGQSHGTGRVAARRGGQRSQPRPGPGGRHSAERPFRRLGLLGPCPSRGGGPHGSRAGRRFRPLWFACDGRRHQHPDAQSNHDSEFSLDTSYGNENTPDGSFWSSIQHGPWTLDFDGEAFNTDGYILVNQQDRGTVDTPANSEHEVGDATLERKFGENGRVFARTTYFRETRDNGTPLQKNRTHVRQLAIGADWVSASAGSFSLRGYGGPQVFDQTFSAVASDRNSESLVRAQRVPAQQTGVSVQWNRPVGTKQTLLAGFDGREVRGSSNELGFFGGRMTSALGAGGRQRTAGVYGEDVIRLTARWQVTAALRFDRWRNYDALSTEQVAFHPPARQPSPTFRNARRTRSAPAWACFIASPATFRWSAPLTGLFEPRR